MTHAAINLHRLPGDLEPGRLHGFINLHGSRDGVTVNVDGYHTRWSVNLTADAAAELARVLATGDALAVADIGIGRAVIDREQAIDRVTLAIKTSTTTTATEMTGMDARDLAQTLAALVKLPE